MQLRDYQIKAINQLRESLKRSKAIVVSIPTGGGKTLLSANFVIEEIRNRNLRILWIAHRKELLSQAAETFRKLGFTDFVVCQSAPKTNINSPLVICGIQKIQRTESNINNPDIVFIDECHRAPSKKYFESLLRWQTNSKFVGLSATPDRIGMGDIFDEIIHPIHNSDLIAAGVLVPINLVGADERTRIKFDDESVGLDWEPIAKYKQHCEGKSTIIFTLNREQNSKIIKEFAKIGVAVEEVHAGLESDKREQILRKFISGEIKTLTNCMILNEGFDAPITECIILCRPCLDSKTYIQIIGRARRCFPGKKSATIIDLTGAYRDHGSADSDAWFCLSNNRKEDEYCLNCGSKAKWVYRKLPNCEWCVLSPVIHKHCETCNFHYEIPKEGKSEGLREYKKKQFPEATIALVDAILTRAPSMVRSARAIDEQLKRDYTRADALIWQRKNSEKDSDTVKKCTYFALVALRERINEERIAKRNPNLYKERFPAAVYNCWFGKYPPNEWDKEIKH